MLLETIEDLKQTVETVTGPELDTKVTNIQLTTLWCSI